MDREFEYLNWEGPLNFLGMVRFRTIADGSCFFHAICNAIYPPYQMGRLGHRAYPKSQFVKDLRHDLSIRLGEPINHLDPKGGTYYDSISRGKLYTISQSLPEYSLENMREELRNSSAAVNNIYNEYISNVLNKDIYILDGITQDVYMTGNDADILYKGRTSIVLHYLPGHYELIGLQLVDQSIQTKFEHDSDFIRMIRDRIRERIKG